MARTHLIATVTAFLLFVATISSPEPALSSGPSATSPNPQFAAVATDLDDNLILSPWEKGGYELTRRTRPVLVLVPTNERQSPAFLDVR